MILAFALLAGCADPTPASIGGQSGTEGPDGCTESARAPVGDPSVPSSGLGFSVDAAVGAVGGEWMGEFAPAADGETAFVLELALFAEQADFVEFEDLASQECPSLYEIPGLATLGLGAALDAEVDLALSFTAADLASGWGTVDAEQVGGTLEPTFDPEQFPIARLSAALTFAGTGGRADLSWTGESAPPPPPTASTATAVASMTEAIGGAELQRP